MGYSVAEHRSHRALAAQDEDRLGSVREPGAVPLPCPPLGDRQEVHQQPARRRRATKYFQALLPPAADSSPTMSDVTPPPHAVGDPQGGPE